VWVELHPNDLLGLPEGYAAPEARYEQREARSSSLSSPRSSTLSARQRAMLILREVFGFPAREVCEVLDTSVVSVSSALQRGRNSLEQRVPERSRQRTLLLLGDERVKRSSMRTSTPGTGGETSTSCAPCLAGDAVFSMPPRAIRWRGRTPSSQWRKPASTRVPSRARFSLTPTGSPRSPTTTWTRRPTPARRDRRRHARRGVHRRDHRLRDARNLSELRPAC
jgi:Sigma-70, region 4